MFTTQLFLIYCYDLLVTRSSSVSVGSRWVLPSGHTSMPSRQCWRECRLWQLHLQWTFSRFVTSPSREPDEATCLTNDPDDYNRDSYWLTLLSGGPAIRMTRELPRRHRNQREANGRRRRKLQSQVASPRSLPSIDPHIHQWNFTEQCHEVDSVRDELI